MNILNNIIKVHKSNNDSSSNLISYSFSSKNQTNNQQLLQFVVKSRFIESIFHDFHTEIIKLATNVFGFIAENKQLSNQIIEFFWQFSINRHESHLRSIFQFLIQLSKQMQIESLEFLFDKFQSIDEKQIIDITIQLISQLQLNAVNLISSQNQSCIYQNILDRFELHAEQETVLRLEQIVLGVRNIMDLVVGQIRNGFKIIAVLYQLVYRSYQIVAFQIFERKVPIEMFHEHQARHQCQLVDPDISPYSLDFQLEIVFD